MASRSKEWEERAGSTIKGFRRPWSGRNLVDDLSMASISNRQEERDGIAVLIRPIGEVEILRMLSHWWIA
jgi:hypothetical protein